MAKSKKQDTPEEAAAEKPAKKAKTTKATAAPASEQAAAADDATSSGAAAKPKKAPRAKKAAAATTAEAAGQSAPDAAPAQPAKSGKATSSTPAKPAATQPVAKPAEAKPAASKSAESKPATPAPSFGGIDTSLAARTAASFVARRDLLGGGSKPVGADAANKPAAKVESGSFKNLKQTLSQPGAGLNKVLGIPAANKKGSSGFNVGGIGGQKGHASTGGTGNKLGVPRRTNG